MADIPKQFKVRTAHVYADAPVHKRKRESSDARIVDIFEALGNLPNLTTLHVDLGQLMGLPIRALTVLFGGPRASKLASLQLTKLQFVGTAQHLQELRCTLRELTSLHSIKINACRGDPQAVEGLLLDPPSLSTIEVTSTSISPLDLSPEEANDKLVQLLRFSPKLKTLSLINLPQGQAGDGPIQALAAELSRNLSTQLTELTIVSSLLGMESGKAISNMLQLNTTIQSLSLQLDWEDSGVSIANMLKRNQTLKSLDLRVYGDEDSVSGSAIEMARALAAPGASKLRKLRLCFEFHPNLITEEVVAAFQDALQTNEHLSKLVLTDSIEKCPLPVSTKTKLRLNRLGVPQLLRNQDDVVGNATAVHEAIVEAIIMAKNDIHVLYDLVSSYPTLCVDPQLRLLQDDNTTLLLEGHQRTLSAPFKKRMTDAAPSPIPMPMPNEAEPNGGKRKTFGRLVMSFFAPSA